MTLYFKIFPGEDTPEPPSKIQALRALGWALRAQRDFPLAEKMSPPWKNPGYAPDCCRTKTYHSENQEKLKKEKVKLEFREKNIQGRTPRM